MNLLTRLLLRSLAALLPPAFRAQYGDEMRWTRERRLNRALHDGLWAYASTSMVELLDLLRTAGSEWWVTLRGAWSGRGRTERTRGDWMGTFMQDIRFAVRGLKKNPGFALIATVTLAVGIGANTAIFSVVDAALFRPLPFEGGDRLAIIWSRSRETDDVTRSWVSYPDYVDLLSEQRSFEAIGAYRNGPVTWIDGDAPYSIRAVYATESLFGVASVEPALGRTILPSEDVIGGDPVAVISHGLWGLHFGYDPGVLGRTVSIDGDVHTIVGVMPVGYAFPRPTDVWLSGVQNVGEDSRGMHRLRVIGRLSPDLTFERASEELATIALRLEEAYPESNDDTSMFAESLRDALAMGARQTLLTLLWAVGLVLVIVCANVANLLLVRATARTREVAVRRALGASRGRLLSQFLVEGLVLATAGGILGIGIAQVAIDLLLASAPASAIPRAAEVGLDPRVLAVAGLVTLSTAALFGLVPALFGIRGSGQISLTQATSLAPMGGHRLRSGLVVVEMALAMVIVFASGLLMQSVRAVQAVDPGFESEDLWILPVVLPFTQYEGDRWPEVVALFRQSLDEVRAIPGVTSAGLTYAPPTLSSWTTGFTIPGRPVLTPSDRPEAEYRPVSEGYFATAGVDFIAGRDFELADAWDAPGAVIVNASFVSAHFPDEDPIGRTLTKESWWEGPPEGDWTIVGVVEDVRYGGREADTRPAFYFPHAQRPSTDMSLVFRTGRDLAEVLPMVRESIWRTDPTIPLESVRAASTDLDVAVASRRFSTGLMGAFGVIALLLAAGGLSGVLSYAVTRRTREMGIRMSLGAQAGDVRQIVVGQALRLVLSGLALGLLGVVAADGMVSSLLFGVEGTDAVTLSGVAVLMVLIGVLSAYGPARRATRVDPAQALRVD